MAPRAQWKGYLRLSLVSCAVELYSATTTSDRVRFNTLNRKTGNRIKQQIVDAVTGDLVESEDKVKGYEIGKDEYIAIEDDELDAVEIESTHTVDIEKFVPRKEVDEIYLDESYYLAPKDKVALEAFSVIREAMRESGMVGIARVVLYRRERLLMLEPRGKGLLATTVRYQNEVRPSASYFDGIQDYTIGNDMLSLASHIIDSKRAKFDPSEFEDRYELALQKLLAAKQEGRVKAEPQSAPRTTNVVNLMDALRKSVESETRGGSSKVSKASGAKPEPEKAAKSPAKAKAPAARAKKAS